MRVWRFFGKSVTLASAASMLKIGAGVGVAFTHSIQFKSPTPPDEHDEYNPLGRDEFSIMQPSPLVGKEARERTPKSRVEGALGDFRPRACGEAVMPIMPRHHALYDYIAR